MTQPYYTEQALEAIARNIIKGYDRTLLGQPKAIPIEEIVESIDALVVTYQYIRKNGRILGETVFDDMPVPIYDRERGGYEFIPATRGTIIVDARLLRPGQSGRYRFTLAHELSHWLIHQEIYTGTGENAAMLKKPAKSSEADKAIERQANRLAGYLLMPSGQVKMAYYRAQTSGDPVASLTELFNVSREAMGIRLKELRLA